MIGIWRASEMASHGNRLAIMAPEEQRHKMRETPQKSHETGRKQRLIQQASDMLQHRDSGKSKPSPRIFSDNYRPSRRFLVAICLDAKASCSWGGDKINTSATYHLAANQCFIWP